MVCDLLVVGCGLSGSEFLCNLLQALCERPPSRPVGISVIDRSGKFSRGIPYSDLSPPDSLLIESVERSTPPDFHEWLVDKEREPRFGRAGELVSSVQWLRQHGADIARRRFADMYCPRHLFGDYQQAKLERSLDRARSLGVASVSFQVDEVVDLAADGGAGWCARLASAESVRFCSAVLSVGAIPRVPHPSLFARDGYIEDLYADGFTSFKAVVRDRPANRIDVAIIGANAGAIELIYCIETDADLRRKIRGISTISTEGFLLPGCLSSEEKTSSYLGFDFPSAPAYVDAARNSIQERRLRTVKGKVVSLSKNRDQIVVRLADSSELRAHVVVHCGGAGRMDKHSSGLIASIQKMIPSCENRFNKGFKLDAGTYKISGAARVSILGPLLNGDTVQSYVESISTIHRIAPEVARHVFEDIIRDLSQPSELEARRVRSGRYQP